jgi:hypothetical protein
VRVSAAQQPAGDPACERAAGGSCGNRSSVATARTASTDTATLLHFRATARVERAGDAEHGVAAPVADQEALADLRPRLAALRGEREAYLGARSSPCTLRDLATTR